MVYVLVYEKLSAAEAALALSLQGIVNRTQKSVFIDVDGYADYLKDNERIYTDPVSLVKTFKGLFGGYVSYTLSPGDVGINMAATVSAAHDILGVPKEIEGEIAALGLKKLYDLDEVKGSPSQRQRTVFDGCIGRLNKNGLVHQVVKEGNFHIRLRDLSVCNRWACVYTDESEEGRELRRYVLGALDRNIPVYGWNDDEIAFIRDISSFGDYALPTDWSCNHSYFERSCARVKQSGRRAPARADKHYVALVVSDGDNIQWLERNFNAPDGAFGQRRASGYEYKMSWTFSPSLVSICPDGAAYIYASAGYDYFISGVSGVGYANCLEYPEEHIGAFARRTAEAMQSSDLRVLCLLDNIKNIKNANFVKERLHNFTKYDIIDGGIWELDPDRYGSGKGRIFFSDGKPFVSVRFTLWYPTCRRGDVTKEWLKAVADEVNAMPVAPDREEGYSVVNVHPWTMDQKDVDYFVSQLDKDRVELVYADELIELVKNNVKSR